MTTEPTPNPGPDAERPGAKLSDAEWMARVRQAMERGPDKPRTPSPMGPSTSAAVASAAPGADPTTSRPQSLAQYLSAILFWGGCVGLGYACYLFFSSSAGDPGLGMVLAGLSFGAIVISAVIRHARRERERRHEYDPAEELTQDVVDRFLG